ncbi:MAG TPA: R3H domain-containing nucleic acid-binding protein [Actinomycetota bacterium]
MSEIEENAAQSAESAGVEPDEDTLLNDQADAAEDFLNGLLDILDMDGEAEASFAEDDTILLNIGGPDLAVLIGRGGATLDAIQDLTRSAVQHASGSRVRLILDIGGYRARLRERLEERARATAQQVVDEGRAARMEPMSAFDRRIVHQVLADFPGVRTSSEGDDPDRRVVVSPS